MSKHVRISGGGRIIIPAALRKRLGLAIGDEVILDVDDDELRARSLHSTIKHAQANVRRYVAEDTGLSDELMEDRRRDAAHD